MLRRTHRNSAMRLRKYTSCPVKRLRELRRMAARNLYIQSQRLLICDWLRPEPRLPTLLHVLSSARNTFLSIESQVPVITFRCHFFVAHSAYPSFWALKERDGLESMGNLWEEGSVFLYESVLQLFRLRYMLSWPMLMKFKWMLD
jgi:hypothetical protein